MDTSEEWVEIEDSQSGQLFYANPTTGECSYQRPSHGRVKPRDPDGEWWELIDERYNLPYYFHTRTGNTDWYRPATGTVIPMKLIQNSVFVRDSVSLQSPLRANPVQGEQGGSALREPIKAATFGGNASPMTMAATSATGPEFYQNAVDLSIPIPVQQRSDLYAKAKTSTISGPVLDEQAAKAMHPLHGQPLNGTAHSTHNSQRPESGHARQDSNSSVRSLPPTLMQDIERFKINGFAQKYFSTHKRGIFRRKVPVEKLLVWGKEMISIPLILMNKNLHKDALKCFKCIQKVMGDRGSAMTPQKTHETIQQILESGVLFGELRDEIYVQLCKQLTNNPNAEGVFHGWELMSVLVLTFPPSKNFEDYLRSFILQHTRPSPTRLDVLAKYCANKLNRICRTGPRGKVPTVGEIERAREAPFNPSVFGETLDDVMAMELAERPDSVVPRILPFLADAVIRLNGCQSEGIFRVPGEAEQITELRLRIEKQRYDMSGITDPNVPASLLKFWLRDLAEPLIPANYYQGAMEASQSVDQSVALVRQLPKHNREVVKYMVRFLQIVADPANQAQTRMTVNNLAMVFAPNFLRCPSDNPQVIFENTKYEQTFLRCLMQCHVDDI